MFNETIENQDNPNTLNQIFKPFINRTNMAPIPSMCTALSNNFQLIKNFTNRRPPKVVSLVLVLSLLNACTAENNLGASIQTATPTSTPIPTATSTVSPSTNENLPNINFSVYRVHKNSECVEGDTGLAIDFSNNPEAVFGVPPFLVTLNNEERTMAFFPRGTRGLYFPDEVLDSETIRIFIDSENAVEESNEEDNVFEIPLEAFLQQDINTSNCR